MATNTNRDNERQPVSKGALLFFIVAVLIIGYISAKLVAPLNGTPPRW